ncbi:MAG: hypothetical protein KAR54_02570 [Candidatus Pacebacteria bacterium]|nr:hypothetical protein [Candidatus Paceibacterota bacterium]
MDDLIDKIKDKIQKDGDEFFDLLAQLLIESSNLLGIKESYVIRVVTQRITGKIEIALAEALLRAGLNDNEVQEKTEYIMQLMFGWSR